MNILYIALATIKRNFRDKRSLFRSILMPILMIIVLGSALGGSFETPKLNKINICYLNQDGEAYSKEFDKFLESQGIKELFNVKIVGTIEEGEKLVSEKEAISLIVVPANYSSNLMSGKEAIVQIYNTKYTDFKNDMVSNIIEVFNSTGNAMTAVSKLNSKNNSYTRFETVEENLISTEGKSPRVLDYYGVAMLILAIMSSASFASDMVSEDYFENVGVRIKASPAKGHERLVGKILGCVIDIFLKGAIIIVFSKFVYKVNWGNNYGMIAFIILSAAVYSTMFGMFITMAIGNGNRASGIVNIISNIFTFLAGGYTIILSQDMYTSTIMHLSPNFYPQTALLNVIYSNNYRVNYHFFNTFGYIAILWVLSALLYIGFITLERRRIV